jgi:hypothetical protein
MSFTNSVDAFCMTGTSVWKFERNSTIQTKIRLMYKGDIVHTLSNMCLHLSSTTFVLDIFNWNSSVYQVNVK